MATSDVTGAGSGGAEAAGMPQLDFSTFPNQIFWLVVTLVAIYFILSKVALPRIGGALEDRYEAVANDLEQASSLKRRAEEAEQAYNAALAEARSEAQRIAAETRAAIQKDVDVATAKASAEIAAKSAESEARIAEIRESATAAVESVANDTVAAIVEALMPGAKPGSDAMSAAVTAAMKG